MQDKIKPDIYIPIDKMQRSYFSWCQIPIVENKGSWALYWDYVGGHLQTSEGGWLLTQDGARRVDYLLSPHAETMVMAWFKVTNPKPKQGLR